jgi:hypothetical protein
MVFIWGALIICAKHVSSGQMESYSLKVSMQGLWLNGGVESNGRHVEHVGRKLTTYHNTYLFIVGPG